ncbi:MAG: energy transducer TonB [Sphingopyxis sp.]
MMIGIVLALLMQAAPALGGVKPPLPVGNQADWVTLNDYPASAQRENRSGTTSMELTISSEGRVTECLVTSSSGSPDLDAAACAALIRRARFEPARDRRGRAVTGTFTKRVRWQAPGWQITVPSLDQNADVRAGGGIVIRIHVRPDGSISECFARSYLEAAYTEERAITECQIMMRRMPGIGHIEHGTNGGWVEYRSHILQYTAQPPEWAGEMITVPGPTAAAPTGETSPLPPPEPEPLPEGVT